MSERHELEGRRKEVREVVVGPWDGKGGESCGEGVWSLGVEFHIPKCGWFTSYLSCHHCPSDV